MTPIDHYLAEIGIIAKPQPKQQQPRVPDRDVSWFKRGEECPH